MALRGFFRLGEERPASRPAGELGARRSLAETRSDNAGDRLLEGAQKLVPGEALAAYFSFKEGLQGATQLAGGADVVSSGQGAADMSHVQVVLALAFLAVTLFLRVIGTMKPESSNPFSTVQWHVVISSGLAYIALVYATNGQIWPHYAIAHQQFYGQLGAAVLGIVVPVIYAFAGARGKSG